MAPGFRQAILSAKMPRRKLEDFPRELVGRRVSLPQEAGGSLEACVMAYNEQTGARRPTCFILRRVVAWSGVL